MGMIQVMPAHLADLIAAGEVVERPGSVVKELTENAVDAGAAAVRIEIEAGGTRLIRVTDDGCGMTAEDAVTAFLRHATSKLRREDELETIRTMGFRGEALAAIAAVSRITLRTRQADSDEGFFLTMEAGRITDSGPVGCPVGTEITVRDLFFNTPARQKYLKRDTSEAANALAAAQKQALAHPEVAVTFLRDGREQLRAPGDGSLISAVYSVLGRDAALSMVPVEGELREIRLNGFVSLPTACRGSRTGQYFFVCGRPVRSGTLTAALEEAYRNRMMTGRYPACVLSLEIPPAFLDVNVHPAKTEVRFLSEKNVFDAVYCLVREALDACSDRPSLTIPQKGKNAAVPEPEQEPTPPSEPEPTPGPMAAAKSEPGAPTERYDLPISDKGPVESGQTLHTALPPYNAKAAPSSGQSFRPAGSPIRIVPGDSEPIDLTDERPDPAKEPLAASPMTPPRSTEPAPIPPAEGSDGPARTSCAESAPRQRQVAMTLPDPERSWHVVGEVLKTYIVVDDGDEVLLIDKHAADERILFERMRAGDHPVVPQLLLSPVVYTPDRETGALLLAESELLAQAGFAVEDFGGGTLLIREVPAGTDPGEAAAALDALAASLSEGSRTDPATARDERLHTVACKAAIRAGDDTAFSELCRLAEAVMSREDLKHCPHGRPICIRLTRQTIEKGFKRIV